MSIGPDREVCLFYPDSQIGGFASVPYPGLSFGEIKF